MGETGLMNREARRALQRKTKKSIGSDGVVLNGGPMNGWFVKADAPALRPDWRDDGHYKRTATRKGVKQAKWVRV